MTKIVIVDDNKIFLDEIYKCTYDFSVISQTLFDITLYDNGSSLNNDILNRIFYDIYLLDIEIPEFDGLKLTKLIREYNKMAIIIFITSYVEYSLIGYEYSVFRYIHKIDLEKKLPIALSSAVKQLELNNELSYIIFNNRRFERIPYRDILYIYKSQKNCILVTDKSEYSVRKSLKKVYDDLLSDEFIIIERGYIINIHYLQTLNPVTAILQNGTKLPVSSSQFKYLSKRIHAFWSKKYDSTI